VNGIHRAYVDGPYGQLHLRIAGDAATSEPLILLHQSPLSGGQFDAVLPGLAERGFCAVALDTPGFGASDLPDRPVGIAGYAAALPAVLNAMGWDAAHVVGHHTGAMIAAHFAAQHSRSIRRLILNGVPLLSDTERAHFAAFRFEPLTLHADGSHLLAAWQQRIVASPGWSDLGAMHRYVVDLLANPVHYGRGFDAAFAHDMATDLIAITAPTMILTNSGEDLFAASQRAHALRPDFAFAALDGGTHDIIDEQPTAWTGVVADFLLDKK
jgi:pimeloyl-ACP methyl ester carboxylesterase